MRFKPSKYVFSSLCTFFLFLSAVFMSQESPVTRHHSTIDKRIKYSPIWNHNWSSRLSSSWATCLSKRLCKITPLNKKLRHSKKCPNMSFLNRFNCRFVNFRLMAFKTKDKLHMLEIRPNWLHGKKKIKPTSREKLNRGNRCRSRTGAIALACARYCHATGESLRERRACSSAHRWTAVPSVGSTIQPKTIQSQITLKTTHSQNNNHHYKHHHHHHHYSQTTTTIILKFHFKLIKYK